MVAEAPPQQEVIGVGELRSQAADIEKRLVDHRARMVQAKKKHEQNMERTKELRKTLAMMERESMSSDYERLCDEEAQMMNAKQRLEIQITSKQSKSIPLGAK